MRNISTEEFIRCDFATKRMYIINSRQRELESKVSLTVAEKSEKENLYNQLKKMTELMFPNG